LRHSPTPHLVGAGEGCQGRAQPLGGKGCPPGSAPSFENNALGLIALYVALGGVAVATHGDPNSISSEDIINGEVKSPDVGNDQIRSIDIRDDTSVGGGLGGVDIAADALTGADVDESTLYNDNSLNSADIASGAVGTDELGRLPAARVRPSVNQTINSSTVTEVALGSELFDIGGLHDNAPTTPAWSRRSTASTASPRRRRSAVIRTAVAS
jgi:hypothetical protein